MPRIYDFMLSFINDYSDLFLRFIAYMILQKNEFH